MKKFFTRNGVDKPKPTVRAREQTPEATGRPIEDQNAPIYQQFRTTPPVQAGSPTRPVQRSASFGVESADHSGGEERWEMLAAQEQRTPADLPEPPRILGTGHAHTHSQSYSSSDLHPPRPESPYSAASSYTPSQAPANKKPKKPAGQGSAVMATVGLLNALNPHAAPQPSPPAMVQQQHQQQQQQSWIDEHASEHVHHQDERREKKPGFWSRESERNNKGKARDVNDPADLVRMIGYLVATNADDWTFVLEVCERTNHNEGNGKEAARALRREFKYSEPAAQLSAAKLWAIMLNNCNEFFALQCGSRKFLDIIEEVITGHQTSPVVRDRLLEVLAGATFASIQRRQDGKKHEKDGYQTLWRKVKTPGKPDIGIPFDTEDAMFNPPTPRRMSAYVAPPQAPLQPLRSPAMADESWPQGVPQPGSEPTRPKHAHQQSKNRVIPLEEDIRRLFQECKVGRGNASLLSQSLAFAKPQDLKKDIIQEFYFKCHASQDFIATQIPWATAGADRSREQRTIQISLLPQQEQAAQATELTVEEQLLADLLGANEELLESLRMYDELHALGLEREAEAKSREDTRMPRSQMPHLDANGSASLYDTAGSGGSQKGSTNGSYLVLPTPNGGGSSRSSSPPSPSTSPAASAPSLGHHSHSGSVQASHGPLPRPPVAIPLPPPPAAPSTPPMQHSLPPALMVGAHVPPARFGPRLPAVAAVLNRSRTPSPERAVGAVYTGANTATLPPSLMPGKAPLPAPPGPPHPAFPQTARWPLTADSVDSAASALRRLDMQYGHMPRGSLDSDEAPTPVKPSAKALGKRRAAPGTPAEDHFDPDDLFHDRSDPPENEWRKEDAEDDSDHLHVKPVQYAYDAVAERHLQLMREGKLAQLADLAAGN